MIAKTDRELEDAANNSSIFDRTAQFVLEERHFAKLGDKLRAAIDDHFKAEFAEYVESLEKNPGIDADLIERMKSMGENVRKGIVRIGLDVIYRRGGLQDLKLVRKILKSGFVESTKGDMDYLKEFGEEEDISLIIATLDQPNSGFSTLISSISNLDMFRSAAEAIYCLGRNLLADLFTLEIPNQLLSYLILVSSNKEFKALRNQNIIRLFDSEYVNVRKTVALKCVAALPKARLTELLNDYVARDEYRYYNVIHWLDFGVSVPRMRARVAVNKLLEKELRA